MSEVTIDSIAIEVDSSAALTAKGIEKLSESLAALRSNARLTTSINNLNKLKNALDGLSSTHASAKSVIELSNALSQLARIQDPDGLRKSINSLNKLPGALSKLSAMNLGQTASHLGALTQALKPLGGIEKSNLGSVINQLAKVPDVSKSLDTRSISEFAMKIQQLTTAMRPLATQMDAIARGFSALPTNINRAVTSLNNYNKSQAHTNKQNGLMSVSFGDLKAHWLAYGYAYLKAADMLQYAMDDFNDRYENMNLFSVAMGEYADDAYKYAEKVSEALGINMSDWARYQGVFMQLGTGFGIVRDKAYSMSKGLTELTYDISSFFNLPVEEAYNKVASGISGELEPLRRLGYALDEATLQQVAYRNGITKSMQEMTQAEKTQIRYVAIVEQSGNAIGDMARTLASPANAIRILRSQIATLTQTFGMLVSVVAAKVIPILQAIVIVVTRVVNAISILLTGKGLKDWDRSAFNVADNYGSAADAANDVAGATKKAADNAKKLKQYTMGWDELNVIDTSPNSTAGSGGSGGTTGGLGGSDLGLDLDSIWTEEMLKGLNTQAEELANTIEKMLPLIAGVGTAFGLWKIGKSLYKEVMGINEAMKGFAAVNGIASTASAFKTLGSALLTAGGGALFFGGAWDSFMNGISWRSLTEQIGGLGLAWLGVDMIFKNSPFGKTAKAIMLVAGGVEMLYSAFREIVTGDASVATVVQAIAGIGLVAGGVAATFGPIPGLITAAVGAIALAAVEIYTHWDQIKDYFAKIDFKAIADAGARAVVSFTDSIADRLPQAISAGADIIVSFVNGVSDNLSDIISSGTDVIVSFIDGISASLPSLIEATVEVIGTVVTSIVSNLPKVIEAGVKLLLALAEGILKSLPEIAKAAVRIMGALLEGIGQLTASVIEAGVRIIASFVSGITSSLGQLITKGGEAVTNLMNGIESKVQLVFDKGAELMGKLISGVKSKLSEIYEVGLNFVSGLIKGIKDSFKNIKDTAVNLGSTLIDSLKDKLDIHSPSREAAEIGTYFVKGLTNAVSEGTASVAASAQGLGSELLSAINSVFDMSDSEDSNGEFSIYGTTMIQSLTDGLTSGQSELYSALKTIAATINTIMSDLVTATQEQAHRIIAAAEAARMAASSIGAASSNASAKVSKKAGGGTVPTGDLFVAGEVGPELVGRIGTSTAVMNQTQIVDAVAAGVANAVQAVMDNNSSTNNVKVYLDGKQIYANQRAVERNRGVQFDGGVFAR